MHAKGTAAREGLASGRRRARKARSRRMRQGVARYTPCRRVQPRSARFRPAAKHNGGIKSFGKHQLRTLMGGRGISTTLGRPVVLTPAEGFRARVSCQIPLCAHGRASNAATS
jgi:hypothetical protein